MLDHVCSLYNFEKQFSCYQTESQVVMELKKMIGLQPSGIIHSISELKDIIPPNSIVLLFAGDKVFKYKNISVENQYERRIKLQTFVIVQDVSQQSPQYYINKTESYYQQ